MNERFLFMPSLAFCLALPYYVDLGMKRIPFMRWFGPIVIGLYLAGFAFKSATRIPAWKNPTTLNAAGVAVSQNSCRANCFMGTALYNDGQDISNREERYQFMLEAEKYIDRSLEIYPTYYSANQMKSGFIAEHYRYDRDFEKLLSGFETVLINKPNVPYIPVYCEYLNGRPNIDRERLMQWYYRVSYDIMLNYHKQPSIALKYAQYGLALDPNNAMINLAAGSIYESAGNSAKANEYYSRALQLDPSLGGE
jgi:tetratricopeptide (TPR) repeat protein